MIKDINEFYFTDDEYDIFAEKYQDQRTHYLEHARKDIQNKLLELNKEILKELPKRNIQVYNHSNSKNITSLTFPCWWNKGKVNWLGVRYGKSPKAIKELNNLIGRGYNDPDYAFHKHACLQVNLDYKGIDIGIFHAVPDGAIDRQYLHDLIDNNNTQLLSAIQTEIDKLVGYGYEWNIWDTNIEKDKLPDFGGDNDPEKTYIFDNENKQNFFAWYIKNDRPGCYSSMLAHFPRYDSRINKANLVNTILDIFEQLYPIYKLISWDIEYKGGNVNEEK